MIIDRNGNADIFYLRANDKKQGKPFSVEKIEAWIRKQKFKTDLIPINADKWVFEKYFYLF
ncbi:hypothetical protein [Niabella ginsengisoli]|uniref:Uncharacterized protein n=1 Tax=Niabella ginsengisoli TaxID=522298 RepID=A0ABS9SME2_9BACT|nr:hypothetical protein [Niabella ginsengisoli]MCH5599548.1 hypothetical protein [Niabella ginsengisoli]